MPYFRTDFVSYTMKRHVTISAIIPGLIDDEIIAGARTHKPKADYPVLYLLNGYWGDSRSWERYTAVERYAEEYQIAIITFGGENNAYVNLEDFMPGSYKDRIFPINYYDFLEKELPDFVESYFPVSARRDDTYIAGLSMGGYGALLHGFSNPSRYRAIGAFSPAASAVKSGLLRPESASDPAIIEKYEPLSIIRCQVEKGEELPDLYYSYGTEDFLFPMCQEFNAGLERLGVRHTTKIVEGMRHEWPLWDRELESFLLWLPRTDFYSKPENNISASFYGRRRKV